MRQDIFGILKSARERGEDVHKTANSLINAGYPAVEVQNALAYLGGGAMGALSVPPMQNQQPMPVVPKPTTQYHQQPASVIQQRVPQKQVSQPNQNNVFPVPQNMQMQPLPKASVQAPLKKDFPIKLFMLILALIILIGALVSTIIFKDSIISLFG